MDFDTYALVLLRMGPRAHEVEGAELDRLQQAHLAHLRAMHERGVLLVAGQFDKQEDETFRGLCLYRAPLDEARALAESDPSVQAGRLDVEVMEWWTEKGALSFPG